MRRCFRLQQSARCYTASRYCENNQMPARIVPMVNSDSRILLYCFSAYSACRHDPVAPQIHSGTSPIMAAQTTAASRKERT